MEVELKLALDPQDVARFRRHPLLKSIKAQRRMLHSIYFDTPDFALLGQGVAFRLRRVGYHWIQTLKAEARSRGILSARPEWEIGVTGNRPDPAVLPEAARAYLSGHEERLQPVFTTVFNRTTWTLEQAGAVIEVALDQGEIRADQGSLPILEVELELKSGAAAALFGAARSLLDTLPMRLEPRNKASRGLFLAGALSPAPVRAAPPDIALRLPAGEAWRRMLSAALSQFAGNVPGVLESDDPEYLHQMRVALRRLASVLALGRVLDLEAPVWAGEFRWLLDELSPARDWDVMLGETLPRVRAGLPRPGSLDDLEADAVVQRRLAGERARRAVASVRTTRAVLAAEADLLQERQDGPETRNWARTTLAERQRKFRKLARRFPELDAASRHRLRIAAKKLRYAGDGFADLYGKAARRYLSALAALQDDLGAANDIAVAHALLAGLDPDGRHGRAVGLVEGYLACEAGQRLQALDVRVAAMAGMDPFW